jgi:hypothetical protein
MQLNEIKIETILHNHIFFIDSLDGNKIDNVMAVLGNTQDTALRVVHKERTAILANFEPPLSPSTQNSSVLWSIILVWIVTNR